MPDQGVGLRIGGARFLEVGADAAPQRGGLADVDDLGLGVLVEVDPGPGRDLIDLLLEGHSADRPDFMFECARLAFGCASQIKAGAGA